jgi:hypothetical protein
MTTGFKSRGAAFVLVALLPLLAGTQASKPPDKSTSILGFTPAGTAM